MCPGGVPIPVPLGMRNQDTSDFVERIIKEKSSLTKLDPVCLKKISECCVMSNTDKNMKCVSQLELSQQEGISVTSKITIQRP